jgi:hypothetical protein
MIKYEKINIQASNGYVEIAFQFNVTEGENIDIMLLNKSEFNLFSLGTYFNNTSHNEFSAKNITNFGGTPYLTKGEYFFIIEETDSQGNLIPLAISSRVHYVIIYSQSYFDPLDRMIFQVILCSLWFILIIPVTIIVIKSHSMHKSAIWLKPTQFKILLVIIMFLCISFLPVHPVKKSHIESTNYGAFTQHLPVNPSSYSGTSFYVWTSHFFSTAWIEENNSIPNYIYETNYLFLYLYALLFLLCYVIVCMVLEKYLYRILKNGREFHSEDTTPPPLYPQNSITSTSEEEHDH